MILHPGILALLAGSCIVCIMVLSASVLGIRIRARWDFQSSSEQQLQLERKTYLISTILQYALLFEMVSALLFVYTIEDIHALFVGAMCATGSLNAHPIGWTALGSKIAVLFLSGFWIVLNRFDHEAEDFPLVRLKYAALPVLAVIIGADAYFQLRYFSGLEPEVITSCCGSLFSQSGSGVAADLASLPAGPVMAAFYGTTLLFFGAGIVCLRNETAPARYAFSALAILLFMVAVAAIISFISVYIYELPTHHCPFDILQKGYSFIGYPIWISLFCGVFFGVLPGLLQPIKRVGSLTEQIRSSEKRWVLLAMSFILAFTVISSWPVVFGDFTLFAP